MARCRLVLQPRRLRDRRPASNGSAPSDAARLQPLQRHGVGSHIPQPDVLHGIARKLQDDTIETVTNSVPTERMRRGDFSELLAIGVQIFDPASARLVNGVVTRDPFPGNIIPTTASIPSARSVLNYFPRRESGPAGRPVEQFSAEQPWTYAYNLQLTRIDHEWTPRHRTYGRFIRNSGAKNVTTSLVRSMVEISRGGTDRFNYNYAVGHTGQLSPSLFLDVKGSWLRFNDGASHWPAGSVRAGYPANTLSLLGDYPHIPRFSIESGSPTTAGRLVTLGAQQSGFNTGRAQPFYNMQFTPTVTWTAASHVEVQPRLAPAAPDGDQ